MSEGTPVESVATDSLRLEPVAHVTRLSRQQWGSLVGAPLGVYALTRFVVYLASLYGARATQTGSLSTIYSGWDGGHYLSIVTNGYPAHPVVSQYSNIAFFPGFPILVRWVRLLTRLTPLGAGVLVSVACGAILVVIFMRLVASFYGPGAAKRAGHPARRVSRDLHRDAALRRGAGGVPGRGVPLVHLERPPVLGGDLRRAGDVHLAHHRAALRRPDVAGVAAQRTRDRARRASHPAGRPELHGLPLAAHRPALHLVSGAVRGVRPPLRAVRGVPQPALLARDRPRGAAQSRGLRRGRLRAVEDQGPDGVDGSHSVLLVASVLVDSTLWVNPRVLFNAFPLILALGVWLRRDWYRATTLVFASLLPVVFLLYMTLGTVSAQP